jgi:hypothetical protein
MWFNSLTKGTHSITAAYGGDSHFSTATSSAVSQVVSDFTLAVASSSSASATVAAGGTATYSLTISPSAGTTFPATATLTATGAPTGSIVTITPSTLPAGGSAANVTITIQVPASAAALRMASVIGSGMAPMLAGILLLPLGAVRRRSGGRAFIVSGGLFVLLTLGALIGCGNNTYARPTPQPTTYTITLTATSGTVTNSTALQLTVQ